MDRKQFTFYESFASALSRIKSKAARCDAYDAICQFALYGTEPDLDSLPDSAAIAFELIRPTLETSKRKAESGKRGGSAEANDKQSASKTEASRKQTAREKENEKEGEKEKEIENECYSARAHVRFVPPTREEAAEYYADKGFSFGLDKWFAKYESNGWKVGRDKMKDWKASMRYWQTLESDKPKQNKMTTFYDVAQKMKQEGLA